MSIRRFTMDEGVRFRSQLLAYRLGQPPYNTPWGGPGSTVKEWWAMVDGPDTKEICAMATLLCDLVPHAAANERSFSMLNEFDSGKTPLCRLRVIVILLIVIVY